MPQNPAAAPPQPKPRPLRRHKEAANLLRQGYSPTKVAAEMKLPLRVVLAYLYREIGEGKLRRSDVLFTIDRHIRQHIEDCIRELGPRARPGRLRRELLKRGHEVHPDDLELYLKLRDAQADLGDMYELIRDLELRLHNYIRSRFTAEYADAWWREGVPLPVREDCAVLHERDQEPAADLFCYTTFMHLHLIFDKKWAVLSAALPQQYQNAKQEFLDSLKRLNRIRNRVMHPVKGFTFDAEDFDFVRDFHRRVRFETNGQQASSAPRAA